MAHTCTLIQENTKETFIVRTSIRKNKTIETFISDISLYFIVMINMLEESDY